MTETSQNKGSLSAEPCRNRVNPRPPVMLQILQSIDNIKPGNPQSSCSGKGEIPEFEPTAQSQKTPHNRGGTGNPQPVMTEPGKPFGKGVTAYQNGGYGNEKQT